MTSFMHAPEKVVMTSHVLPNFLSIPPGPCVGSTSPRITGFALAPNKSWKQPSCYADNKKRQPKWISAIVHKPLAQVQLNTNSFARCAAFTTALINVTRSFPSSNSNMPSIVQPAGVVTASFSIAG